MTKENFSPEFPHQYPIEDVGGERYLVYCFEHQRVQPKDDSDEEKLLVEATIIEITELCDSFKIKSKNVVEGLCKTCFHNQQLNEN